MKHPRLAFLLVFCLGMASANAQNKLLISRDALVDNGYGYGGSNWSDFTSLLDSTAAGQSTSINVVNTLEDASVFADARSLLVCQRWFNGALSSAEMNNIGAFIASGKRVLLIGENGDWYDWNNQILSLVGDTFARSAFNGASAVSSNSLTAGVSTVYPTVYGLSAGNTGTSLFSQDFSRLYGPDANVLTVLDVNIFQEDAGDNRVFVSNIADWLLASDGNPTPVPEPSTYGLVGAAALLALVACRRFSRKA